MEEARKEFTTINIKTLQEAKDFFSYPEDVVEIRGWISSVEKVQPNLTRARLYAIKGDTLAFIDVSAWNPEEGKPGFKFADYFCEKGVKKAKISGKFKLYQKEKEDKVYLNVTPFRDIQITPPSDN